MHCEQTKGAPGCGLTSGYGLNDYLELGAVVESGCDSNFHQYNHKDDACSNTFCPAIGPALFCDSYSAR